MFPRGATRTTHPSHLGSAARPVPEALYERLRSGTRQEYPAIPENKFHRVRLYRPLYSIDSLSCASSPHNISGVDCCVPTITFELHVIGDLETQWGTQRRLANMFLSGILPFRYRYQSISSCRINLQIYPISTSHVSRSHG